MKQKKVRVIHAENGTPEHAPIHTDVQGSYTGRPADVYETPVQDADDL